jgi:GTP-binding protein
MKFVDEVSFAIASGSGGPGAVSFRREKYVPRGGPDGGDGGHGGALIVRASSDRNTLVDFRFNKTYRAESGHKGDRRNMTGKDGDDLVLLVPIGTVLSDDASREVLADLATDGATWTLAGGRGGKGNSHFATSTHRTPRFAQEGEVGTEMRVHLELRLLADVGLVGLPNAGKSTLLSVISAARPKIAPYPFTTLVPNLGVVDMGEGRSFVVADVPGLIEGAAEGAGLGHRFLRHLERCRVLVHLVAAGDEEPSSVDERVVALERELAAYDPELAKRDRLIVLTKVDLIDGEQRKAALQALSRIVPDPLAISAVTGEGVRELTEAMWARTRPSPS